MPLSLIDRLSSCVPISLGSEPSANDSTPLQMIVFHGGAASGDWQEAVVVQHVPAITGACISCIDAAVTVAVCRIAGDQAPDTVAFNTVEIIAVCRIAGDRTTLRCN